MWYKVEKHRLYQLKFGKKIFDQKSAKVRKGADVGVESDISFNDLNSKTDFRIVVAFY